MLYITVLPFMVNKDVYKAPAVEHMSLFISSHKKMDKISNVYWLIGANDRVDNNNFRSSICTVRWSWYSGHTVRILNSRLSQQYQSGMALRPVLDVPIRLRRSQKLMFNKYRLRNWLLQRVKKNFGICCGLSVIQLQQRDAPRPLWATVKWLSDG